MTKKTRCSKCQRVFFTLTARRDRTRSLAVPAYGISMAPLDPRKFTYVLTCTKCGNREVHVVPVEPPLQSPAGLGGQANALTGGIAFTGLPDADEAPPEGAGESAAP
jgi:hypothetical protein